MTKETIWKTLEANPVSHLATDDHGQPRVRAVLLYTGRPGEILFHTGSFKDLYAQLSHNSRVELCFQDAAEGRQIRINGMAEEVEDRVLKDEICEHPTRTFLKAWRESGTLENFYETFKVYRIADPKAHCWTMGENFAPKREIAL